MKLKHLLTVGVSVVLSTTISSSYALAAELAGNITVWHSFTQGPRLEVIQQAANDFMTEHPKVKIKIETFSWNDFYTKWTTGFASGNVPDMSTALPNQVVEMINIGALAPVNDLIDKIGRDKFSEAAINEGTVKGQNYSLPLYSHAQVMWIRKDLLKKHNLEVPKTWEELYQAAKVLTQDGVYGLSVPMGTNDFMATRFLNFYVRSGGGSLLTKDLKVDLTSPLAQEGIKYWVKLYKEISPKDSINYDVLKQATLFYQGKTAFDFNSGFQIGGVKANSPQLLAEIDAYPLPKINANDPDRGIETSNVPLVIWKASKHPEISKAFIETLYQKERYIKFLQSVPVGMLPAIKGISDEPAYANNPMVKQFSHAESVIEAAVEKGAAIGYEHGPTIQGGLLTNQHIIEAMFQDIVANGTDPKVAAEKAEKQLNELFEMVAP
ncbi:ABC transporter substrate-binding protein [Gallibacterium trehalosifermentans]|uniref:ABC transporter substrate-binding protein n=1 Tax=Gallibacterium trehalosifermentans TaxID=516935 RepID=A0ABV6H2J7_9PAST